MSLTPQMEALKQRRLAERAVTPTRRRVTPGVSETVTVRPLPSIQPSTHLLSSDEDWGWEEIRDYVVGEIEGRWGPFPRDFRKEATIFKRWAKQYGKDAPAIARYAFENCGGTWKGAPISVNRFCKGSDQWFSDVILKALNDTD